MKRLLILSGKGGTGKTTTAAAFAAFSNTRAAADCDVDAPNLHLILQPDTPPQSTTFWGGEKAQIDPALCTRCGTCAQACRFHAITRESDAFQVVDYACEGCGVCALTCPAGAVTLTADEAGQQRLYSGDRVFSTAELRMGRGNSGKLVTAVKLALFQHAPETDVAIIDGSPGIGCPVISSVSGMDLVLVVAEPSVSGLHDLERLVTTASTLQTQLAVCVNKWDTSPENTAAIEAFCHAREIPFTGRIPYDPAAGEAINQGRSLAEVDCPASRALRQVYASTMRLLASP